MIHIIPRKVLGDKITMNDLWGLKKIQADKAWDISQGENVVVAVVDSGVDYTHEDIKDNIWINKNEIPDNGVDDDDNGFIDDVRGWDFTSYDVNWEIKNRDNDPLDENGHGTHVGGTIAAIGNNNMGVIGVAPKAKIMAVKAGENGLADVDIVDAIKYAADMGARVINMSWGGH